MPARKHHGIYAATYGTAANPTTAINKLDAAGSSMSFPDQEDNPKDAHDNEYAGLQYAEITINALDLTAFAAIYANWKADTKQFFKLTLDNGQTATTSVGVLLTSCRPVEIKGKASGRADAFSMSFRVPYDQITFV